MEKSITGFIGAGNMAWAIMGALIRSKVADPDSIIASDVSEARLEATKAELGILTTTDNHEVFSKSSTLILAVKPQQMNDVLSGIAKNPGFPSPGRRLVISIAAGIRIQQIEDILYAGLTHDAQKLLPIVRVMPNTPALVGQGMSGMAKNIHTTDKDAAMAEKILGAAGQARWFDEDDINAVTALSGSGPAYVFYLAEAMIQGGIRAGLSEQDSRVLALQTIKGAAMLLENSKEHPIELRKKVTSKGGTTEAAIAVFDEKRVKQAIVDGMIAAKKRGDDLASGK